MSPQRNSTSTQPSVERVDLQLRLQNAVQSYWQARAINQRKQRDAGKLDAGTRGEVTGGTQMGAMETLVVEVLQSAGLNEADIRTRTALELPGHFRATKKWDLVVVSGGRLVMAMEFKSQAGSSIGNNINNRAEEAVGTAKDLWTAYREGRFGDSAPPPFLGYVFLLQDQPSVNRPVSNKVPHFDVDPVFRGLLNGEAPERYRGVSYADRYELLCRRLVLERLYSAACFLKATNATPTVVTQPAVDLSFARFVAAVRGHVVTFLGG